MFLALMHTVTFSYVSMLTGKINNTEIMWITLIIITVSHYVAHDAHHSQTHPQQRTLTQHDMLPQHSVNIMELFCECFFLNDFSKEQRSSLRMILGSKNVGAI